MKSIIPNESHLGKPVAVVKGVNGRTVIIDKGSMANIGPGQRVVIYGIGDEVRDAVSGSPLGRLEIVKAAGTVSNVSSCEAQVIIDKVHARQRNSRFRYHTRSLRAAVGSSVKAVQTAARLKPVKGDKVKLI